MPSHWQEDAGVSPVIGTILLVAIVVVLSAAVFVMVGQLNGDRAEPAPSLALASDKSDSQATVVHAEAGLDWYEDMRVSGTCEPLLNGDPFPTAAGVPVKGGDVLTCDSGEDLELSSSPAKGNALLYRTEFP